MTSQVLASDQQLAQIVAKAVSESQAQLSLVDVFGILGFLAFLAVYIWKNVYLPYQQIKQGKNPVLTTEETQRALAISNQILKNVEEGNAVILHKDQYGQNSLLNMPKWLQDMTGLIGNMATSQQRIEKHTTQMVNHQSDVLQAQTTLMTTLATTMAGDSKAVRTTLAALNRSVKILIRARKQDKIPSPNLP